MKTYLYNFDPLKPHLYIVKLGFTGVYNIFFFLLKNIDYGYSLERLGEAALTCTHNNICFEQKYEKYQNFYLKTQFLACFRNGSQNTIQLVIDIFLYVIKECLIPTDSFVLSSIMSYSPRRPYRRCTLYTPDCLMKAYK